MLHAQFSQIAVSRTLDIAAVGKAQTRPEKPQQINAGGYRRLFLCVQPVPPVAEFIRVFNVPDHANMPPKEYKLKNINLDQGWECRQQAFQGKLFVHSSEQMQSNNLGAFRKNRQV